MTRLLLLPIVLAVISPAAGAGTQTRSAGPMALAFNGTDFVHRWSKDGQHEFTPQGEEDLAKWNTMLTLNVHDAARTGDQLAEVANRVLGNYQQAGNVIRTDSKARTATNEAEHFAVAILPNPAFLEAAFARFLLNDGRGVVVVYSKRVYGAKAGDAMSAWLAQNGADMERLLMAWTGLPPRTALNALPQK